MRPMRPLIVSAASSSRQASKRSILNCGVSEVLSTQLVNAACHSWKSILFPAKTGILMRSNCPCLDIAGALGPHGVTAAGNCVILVGFDEKLGISMLSRFSLSRRPSSSSISSSNSLRCLLDFSVCNYHCNSLALLVSFRFLPQSVPFANGLRFRLSIVLSET